MSETRIVEDEETGESYAEFWLDGVHVQPVGLGHSHPHDQSPIPFPIPWNDTGAEEMTMKKRTPHKAWAVCNFDNIIIHSIRLTKKETIAAFGADDWEKYHSQGAVTVERVYVVVGKEPINENELPPLLGDITE